MFQPSQLVVLLSGGPKMTVAKVEGDLVTCVWHKDGVTKRETFEACLLKLWEPPKAFPPVTADYF